MIRRMKMNKFLCVIPVLAVLAGCNSAPEVPCMASNEKGTVVRATTTTQEYCGRGGCSRTDYTYININVAGVSRTCIVSDSTASMFAPGEVINLSTGRRL